MVTFRRWHEFAIQETQRAEQGKASTLLNMVPFESRTENNAKAEATRETGA